MSGAVHEQRHVKQSDRALLLYHLRAWARKGGKRHRQKRVRQVLEMLDDLNAGGPRAVSQRIVREWICAGATQRMRYERYLAAAIFWKVWNGSVLKRPRCADPPPRV